MRSFPTLRDAEIAYSQLEDRLGKLEKKITLLPSEATMTSELSNKFGNQRPGVTEVTNITNVNQESIDSILSADGQSVYHNLWHVFRNNIRGMGMLELGGNGWPVWRWVTNNSTANMQLNYVDPTVAKNFAMWFTAAPTLNQAELLFEGIVGQISVRVAKIYVKALNVLPGANPTAGMVLTALDATGECYWAFPGTANSFANQVFISTNQALISGTFVDVSNCSMSLTLTGKYIVKANIATSLQQNDSQIKVQALQNQAGAFFVMNGEYELTKDPATPGVIMTSSYTWYLNVSTVPCTVKLMASKFGTGSSYLDLDTSLVIFKVG